MNFISPALHAGTPEVTVAGSAGPVRTLRFLRHPKTPNLAIPARILISRTVPDVRTRTVRLYGARLLTGDATAATTVSGLNGQTLRLHTADGDVTFMFPDASGRPLWTCNAQGTITTLAYEDRETAARPLSITETIRTDSGLVSRVREAFTYASANEAHRARNLAGTLTVHRHNAGLTRMLSMSITGQPLSTEEQLLAPEAALPDWPGSDNELDTAVLTSPATYDATGARLMQTNAACITTVTAYDISGAVKQIRLRYRGLPAQPEAEVVILRNLLRRADGVVLSQTAGNGVTEQYNYDLQTQRLKRHTTARPVGHPLGPLVIRDLHYAYDPAGNILQLDDRATATRWHANRMTNGKRYYTYDTLSRLTSATGRERLADTSPGPQTRLKTDGAGAGEKWFPYTEQYTYDDGDNLTVIAHQGKAPWTRTIAVSAISNRALVAPKGGTADPDSGFLAGGLQRLLADGRRLAWYADGQLYQVSPVTRPDSNTADDTETYRYRNGGTRVRKVRSTRVSSGTRIFLTTYAGGIESRQRWLNDSLQRDIVITEAGSMRLIQNRLTGEAHLRYAFMDHLNSSGGETDGNGGVTSREEYYPYGGSAGGNEEVEQTADRTRRYSGKERDATGLYYYGHRYCQPETGRWLSADPAGLIDGVNLFRFCRANPVNITDPDGRAPSFSEAFKSERGDLFFGLGTTIGSYRTWWGIFSYRLDYLAVAFSLKQTITVAEDIFDNFEELFLEHKQGELNKVKKIERDFLNLIKRGTRSAPSWVFIPFPESGKNAPFREKFTRHLAREGYRYSVRHIITGAFDDLNKRVEKTTKNQEAIAATKQWKLDTGRKVISRLSKAAIDMLLNAESGEKIHFILDGINMDNVIEKKEISEKYSDRSTTASELRFLYRNKDRLGDKVIFYRQALQVPAPWHQEPQRWSTYEPKRQPVNIM